MKGKLSYGIIFLAIITLMYLSIVKKDEEIRKFEFRYNVNLEESKNSEIFNDDDHKLYNFRF